MWRCWSWFLLTISTDRGVTAASLPCLHEAPDPAAVPSAPGPMIQAVSFRPNRIWSRILRDPGPGGLAILLRDRHEDSDRFACHQNDDRLASTTRPQADLRRWQGAAEEVDVGLIQINSGWRSVRPPIWAC